MKLQPNSDEYNHLNGTLSITIQPQVIEQVDKFGNRPSNAKILPKSKRQRLEEVREKRKQNLRHDRNDRLQRISDQMDRDEDRYSVMNQLQRLQMKRENEHKGYNGEWQYIKPDGYDINTEISNELLVKYKQTFKKYLEKLCIHKYQQNEKKQVQVQVQGQVRLPMGCIIYYKKC